MPNPALWLLAIIAASIGSAIGALVLGGGRAASDAWKRAAGVVAIAIGLADSYSLLGIQPAWPPTSGLGRWLLIVYPLAIGIELIASHARVGPWQAWLARAVIAAALTPLLLHGSVYLVGSPPEWATWQTIAISALIAAILIAEWWLLARLAQCDTAGVIPVAIAMASLSGGIAVMVAGYVTGGEASLPLTGALLGCVAGTWRFCGRSHWPGIVGIGIVGLFSLVLVGRFFGGISTTTALLVLLAPLLCYSTELWSWRDRRPWLVGAVRLALVAVPLSIVLMQAKRDFDQKLRPLVPMRHRPSISSAHLSFAQNESFHVVGGASSAARANS